MYKLHYYMVLVLLLSNAGHMQAKLSTSEKIAVVASAAGVALGACLAADALDDLDFNLSANFTPRDIHYTYDDDLLDDIDYFMITIKNSYYYELKCIEDYKNTDSLRLRELIHEELYHYMKRSDRYKNSQKIDRTILPRLRKFVDAIESRLQHDFWQQHTISHQQRVGYKKATKKIKGLIKKFELIYDMIDSHFYARPMHYRIR